MSPTPSSPMPWNKLRGAPAHRRPPPSDTAAAAGAVGSDLLLPAPMPMPPAVDVSPAALLDAAAALRGGGGGGRQGLRDRHGQRVHPPRPPLPVAGDERGRAAKECVQRHPRLPRQLVVACAAAQHGQHRRRNDARRVPVHHAEREGELRGLRGHLGQTRRDRRAEGEAQRLHRRVVEQDEKRRKQRVHHRAA
eukprot:1718234-Prymnesium_polylepis.1